MAKHAKLSASTSDRWLACPGSIKLSEAQPPKPTNDYARLGTAAHFLGEQCIREGRTPDYYLGQVVRMEGKENDEAFKISKAAPSGIIPEKDFRIDEQMVSAVEIYVNYVTELLSAGPEQSHVEKYFKGLGKVHKDMGGTADFAVVYPFDRSEIVDYKHGAGVMVEVENNNQLKIYGLGIYMEDPSVEEVKVTIVQPRIAHRDGPVRSVVYSAKELERFKVQVAEGAKATEKKKPKLESGPHCRFCPVLDTCPEMKKTVIAEIDNDFSDDPPVLEKGKTLPMPETDEDLGRVLSWMPVFESWFKAIAVRAQQELEAGRKVPGFKLVDKYGNRAWIDNEADIIDEFAKTFKKKEATFMELPKPEILSPAQMEKVKVKKADKEKLKELVKKYAKKPHKGYTVVPDSDRREAVNPYDEFDDDPPIMDDVIDV